MSLLILHLSHFFKKELSQGKLISLPSLSLSSIAFVLLFSLGQTKYYQYSEKNHKMLGKC